MFKKCDNINRHDQKRQSSQLKWCHPYLALLIAIHIHGKIFYITIIYNISLTWRLHKCETYSHMREMLYITVIQDTTSILMTSSQESSHCKCENSIRTKYQVKCKNKKYPSKPIFSANQGLDNFRFKCTSKSINDSLQH